ncbi:amino acid adenylation domain-containing protein [Halomonas sp. AOP42-D1-22]|uniref:amino acid adenylation domain-containing protein n=1 Tax=Halomonas sp. AOP42-D1-22 TaxID=3457667 RepID=UPI004034BD5A
MKNTLETRQDDPEALVSKFPGAAFVDLPSMESPLTTLSPIDQQRFQHFGWGASINPRFHTLLEAINYQIATRPKAVAAEYQGQTLTYSQLDAAANQLALVLSSHGVQRGDVVCLYLRRSFLMLVGIVAAMRVGAAYVPQHLGVAPPEMLSHIAKISGAKVILTLSAMAPKVAALQHQHLIFIDSMIDSLAPDVTSPRFTGTATMPEEVAMILFTSGTTGVPNGVQVTHRNLCNILQTAPGDLGMGPGMRVGQVLSIAFDMATWEVLGALSNGATLVIRGNSIQETAESVDVLIATPSILASLDADRCRQVKVVAVAGEPCPRSLADRWSSFCRFYNSCGPTETTIINTAEEHRSEKPVLSIGRPTPNNTIYILDENLHPQPIGIKGEIWAGGDCVTMGYLGNKPLTNERYLPDPFRPGHMMFRTRDLGRWTDDGELEHFGRIDDQVKVRGFRVELDAVSSVLEDAEGCLQAATLKYDDRTLVSFVTPASSVNLSAAVEAVAAKLPYYCVPAAVLPMDTFPHTSRGKLDKRALMQIAQVHFKRLNAEPA